MTWVIVLTYVTMTVVGGPQFITTKTKLVMAPSTEAHCNEIGDIEKATVSGGKTSVRFVCHEVTPKK